MSEQSFIPSREQLAAIVETTASFLEYLHDALLIEGVEAPPIPQATIPYRRVHAVFRWAEWEQSVNLPGTRSGDPTAGTVAGGWLKWRELHLALVDMEVLRGQLIAHWGLAAIVGSKSVQPSLEATGKPGGGEKGFFIIAEKVSSAATADHVRIEKSLDWPPPIPRDWIQQCRYVLKRIENVMNVESTTSTQRTSDPNPQSTVRAFAAKTDPQDAFLKDETEGIEMPEQWTVGTFLAKAKELSRRLRSWHVEDCRYPIQFASERETRRWVRLTFREIITRVNETSTPRPERGLQLYPNRSGEPDEDGSIGEIFENPDSDTDNSLTMWLMGDFLRHLAVAPKQLALDYLRESYGHLLDLPAWTVRLPHEGEPWPGQHGTDKLGELRSYMVIGRVVPVEFLENLTDAAEKLLTLAGSRTKIVAADEIHESGFNVVDPPPRFRKPNPNDPADVLDWLSYAQLLLAKYVPDPQLDHRVHQLGCWAYELASEMPNIPPSVRSEMRRRPEPEERFQLTLGDASHNLKVLRLALTPIDAPKDPAPELIAFTLQDLLSALGEVEWYKWRTNELHEKAQAAGNVNDARSAGGHYSIQASIHSSQGAAKANELHSKPGAKLLKTICLAKGKSFDRDTVAELCAALALSHGQTLDDLLAIDAEKVVSELAGTTQPNLHAAASGLPVTLAEPKPIAIVDPVTLKDLHAVNPRLAVKTMRNVISKLKNGPATFPKPEVGSRGKTLIWSYEKIRQHLQTQWPAFSWPDYHEIAEIRKKQHKSKESPT